MSVSFRILKKKILNDYIHETGRISAPHEKLTN